MEEWNSKIEVSKEDMLKEVDEAKSKTPPELYPEHLQTVWRHS